jgi:hypothetical protein
VLYRRIMVTAAPSDRCANLHKPYVASGHVHAATAEPEEGGAGRGLVTASRPVN